MVLLYTHELLVDKIIGGKSDICTFQTCLTKPAKILTSWSSNLFHMTLEQTLHSLKSWRLFAWLCLALVLVLTKVGDTVASVQASSYFAIPHLRWVKTQTGGRFNSNISSIEITIAFYSVAWITGVWYMHQTDKWRQWVHVENVQFIRQSPEVSVARGHMYMTIVCYNTFVMEVAVPLQHSTSMKIHLQCCC